MARMEIISGIERRRRWPLEVKLSILAEAAQPGARVCDVGVGMTFIHRKLGSGAELSTVEMTRRRSCRFVLLTTILPSTCHPLCPRKRLYESRCATVAA